MTSTVKIKCCRCRREMTVKVLDPRWPAGTFLCDKCSGPKREGAAGVWEEDAAVEIAELDADGAVVTGSVKF